MKTKKRLAVLIMAAVVAIAAAVGLAIGLTSCKIDEASDHEHVLTHTAAVEATCTQAGNVEYWYCAGCGKYFSDAEAKNEVAQSSLAIAATGHTFVDGVCTVCGVSDESIAEDAVFSYYNLVKSVVEQGGFSVVIDTSNSTFSLGNNKYEFESGELTLSFKGGVLSGWVTGEILMDDGSVALQGYINDDTVYYSLTIDGDKIWSEYSIEELMMSMDDESTAIIAMSMQANKMLYDGIMPLIETAASKNSAFIESVLEKVCNSIFDVQTKGDSVTLVLDAQTLSATYTLLTTSSISEIIDYYCGSGTYFALQSLAASFDTLTLENAIALVENAAGISRTDVISVINDLVASMGGGDIDVSEYLTSDILALTVDEVFKAFSGSEDFVASAFVGSYLEQFKNATVFDLLVGYGFDSETVDGYADYLISLIDECASIVITTDAQGNVKTADIIVNYEGEIQIAAGVQLVNGGKTDSSFVDSLIAEVDALYEGILVDGNVLEKISTLNDSYYGDDETIEDNSYAVVSVGEDGSIILTVIYDKTYCVSYDSVKIIENYKGRYVLTNVICLCVTGEDGGTTYEYDLQGISSGSITYSYSYYEDERLLSSDTLEITPSTLYYYLETDNV